MIPTHLSPPFSEDALKDALFHYTTGVGLQGILSNKELWSTAYFCMNDESELKTGRGVLASFFRLKTHDLIEENAPAVQTISARGVDILEYPRNFEDQLIGLALSDLCIYLTCYCKPATEEEFTHGLLSQWRGYGPDGGYALQFSRTKLESWSNRMYQDHELNYDLNDVNYDKNNPLKDEVLKHQDAFTQEYLNFLEEIMKFAFSSKPRPSPLGNLTGGPLESLLNYMTHTKNVHFREEQECRLSYLDLSLHNKNMRPVHYFNRNGLIIPYVKTPEDSGILDCMEWIIVGPGPRIESRFNSVRHMIKTMGLNIQVRPSHIPFSQA